MPGQIKKKKKRREMIRLVTFVLVMLYCIVYQKLAYVFGGKSALGPIPQQK